MIVSACACGHFSYPPRNRCAHCGGEMQRKEHENKGTVISSTEIFVTPAGFPDHLFLALVASGRLTIICRADSLLADGECVSLEEREYGLHCISVS